MSQVEKADVKIMDRLEELLNRICGLEQRMAPYLEPDNCEVAASEKPPAVSPIMEIMGRLQQTVERLHGRLVV